MRELGIESIMVNSNPETVSTDYDTSDILFFEPLTTEDVLNIFETVQLMVSLFNSVDRHHLTWRERFPMRGYRLSEPVLRRSRMRRSRKVSKSC